MSRIVVGYDGSASSGDAVRWAAGEARVRGCGLVVCVAWELTLLGQVVEHPLSREHGAEILRRGLGCATAVPGAAPIESMLVRGSPAAVLHGAAASADMLVIGARGHGGLPGLLLGSVPAQLAGHCPVPLVVVRGRGRPANGSPGPVVAALDGSAGSAAAAEFAFREAELHDAVLVAVCALADAPGSLASARRVEEDFGQLMDRLEKEHPDVLVQRNVEPGGARTALLWAANHIRASLLVVGTRGRGGFRGMPLGSVAQAVLQHAGCPVAVIPSGQ